MGFDLGILLDFRLFNPFLIQVLLCLVVTNVVYCCSVESGLNSGLRVNFRGFRFEFLHFSGFSAILIAIKMNIDRDQDEHFPRSGRTLIAICLKILVITIRV